MLQRINKSSMVKTSILILSIILLDAVMAMAYGYFHNNSHTLYLGLCITFATGFTIIFQSILPQNILRARRKS